MLRWLWAAALLAASADAWRPPHAPLLLEPKLRARTRRQAHNASSHHLHLLGWHLDLHENQAIRSPYYNECKFYKGRVLYEDHSSATVTDCEGHLYGLMQVGKEEFVLQPTQAPEGAHVLRRRDVFLSEQPVVYNLTGDTADDLELDLDAYEPVPQLRLRSGDNSVDDVEYFRDNMPISRPMTGVKGLWLEMAIVADHTMLKFHGRERVKHYILALMNIVSAIFNDPSLDTDITLVINKLFLYEDRDSIIKHGNIKKSLEAVNKWNHKHLMKLPADTTGWDATLWLTRLDLGGPSGFAPVGGVCSRNRAATINRDEGLTSAFVIAHELGHLLGLTHDGENQCAMEAYRGSVMSPTVPASLHNYAWSACSKKLFHEKAKGWWCLHERSSDKGVELGGARALPNYVFTMDEQCRTEFGEGFSRCKAIVKTPPCARLWCGYRDNTRSCTSKRAPPLEGTPCGKNHWCVNQVCEPMPGHAEDRQEPAAASWDDWSAWTSCGADCGYGLRTRIRRCRYKGSISATACEGAGSQVATCWAGRSCAAVRDIRTDICRRQSNHLIPFFHHDEKRHCEIWCVDYSGGSPSNFGALPDGTPCSYDKPYDLCFQGTCVRGQCSPSDASCNWCPDGYCNNNTHVYIKHLGKGWTRMAAIPHEARLLSVRVSTPVPLHVALRERKRDRPVLELMKHSKKVEQGSYWKYDPHVPQNLQIIEVDSNVIDIKEGDQMWEGEVVAAGTVVKWRQTDAEIHVTSNSALQTDLMIMAIPEKPVSKEDMLTVSVSVNYSTPSGGGRARPLEYRWATERGPCSVSCGGGARLVRPRCPRDRDPRDCAPTRYEPCNTHLCEFAWSAGEWEECSATCGERGVQERQLFCVPSNVTTNSRRDLIRHSVSPALCPSDMPLRIQPCQRLPCPVYWQELPWTPCSTTCGRGVSRRPLVCPAQEELLCGPRPKERRRRCRVRRCPPAPATLTACPLTDTTPYCEVFSTEQLKRNCVLSYYRKICCNACRSIDYIERRGAG